MPSIESVEQFKTIVQGLAREPEIRSEMGLPAEDIRPPESQLDTDLADLLGGGPEAEPFPGLPEDDFGETPEAPATENPDLDDLFAAPLPDLEDEPTGPSLDDLLGAAPAPETEPTFDTDFDLPPPEEASFPELTDDPGTDSDEMAEPLGDFGALDDLFGSDPVLDEPAVADPEPELPPPGFDEPFGAPFSDDEELEFGDALTDADFPELADLAKTREEDVEAFDALQEADEFQLGDFESQFGITADDHTDAEVLNPAQAVDLDVEAAQKNLSLTDEEFLDIQRSLGLLPLNLRLAIEELIGEKEVVFDDLDRVIRLLVTRAPLRTLASAVGKILGKKITIPPGFEKGLGADIEARHGTLWYNLRTIMFPILRVALIATVVAAILVVLGWNFLMRPWKANDLYDKGLVAVKQNDGVTCDDLFAQAYYYWPVQDRFFQYAEAYEDTGDYDRARRKFLELLRPSVRPYRDEDKAELEERYGKPLQPLPSGLEGKALTDRLAAKKAALDRYYDYVTRLLSTESAGADIQDDIPGEVVLGNPDPKGILEYSEFETNFGFDGRDRVAHFRRADAILAPLLAKDPGSKEGLLRKADNDLAWAQALSSKDSLNNANAALSEYMRRYGFDAPVTWRFVRVFILEDQESELLKLRDRIAADKKMVMDGPTVAQLARWLIDRDEFVTQKEREVTPAPKTIEDEYGVRPKVVEPPEVPQPKATSKPLPPPAPAEGGSSAEGEGEKKKVQLLPPYKYPYASEPFRPNYLDKVDTLLLRAMDTEKSLPELHYELSRYYQHDKADADERRALAAADTYFQRLEPRMSRLNGRPAMRVATSNRIGEIFDAMGQPLQAEKYYLDAQKNFEAYRQQGLVTLDADAAKVYRNLGNLYYHQTPGVEANGRGFVPGGWDQALKLYEIAEEGHAEAEDVSYRLGVIEYEKQDFDAAVKKFFSLDHPGNRGESSGRTNPNLLYAMANSLFRSGNFASAEGYYRQLLTLLRDQRAKITHDWDPVGRASHKALAQRIYETWNNLAAAEYRASNSFRAGTPEFRESLAALTTARAQAQILGRDLYEDKKEVDVTRVDSAKLQSIRDNEAQIVAKTRQEKGLVEANMEVLSLLETAPLSRRELLARQLEIFARIPLELDQLEAP